MSTARFGVCVSALTPFAYRAFCAKRIVSVLALRGQQLANVHIAQVYPDRSVDQPVDHRVRLDAAAEPPVPFGVRAALRQVLPLAGARLLRWQARLLVDRDEAERRIRQQGPGGRLRRERRRGIPDPPFRQGRPLQMARMDRDMRAQRHRPLDVQEGLLARQRRDGGLLRQAEEH